MWTIPRLIDAISRNDFRNVHYSNIWWLVCRYRYTAEVSEIAGSDFQRKLYTFVTY